MIENFTFKQKTTWKKMKGYKGYYIINNHGEIRNNYGNIMKPFITDFGYKRIGLTINKKQKKHFVHRLVALQFIQKIEGKNEINHIDGNPANNNVKNLEWCTRSENVRHSYKIGNAKPVNGERNGRSKFKTWQVLKMRELYNDAKLSVYRIAKMFNASWKQTKDIITKKYWKHV